MKISDVISFLETWAPPALQESYDNSRLIIGDDKSEVTGVLISLDCIESIVDEAIEKNCNLIVSHHPIVFSGLKSLTGKNYIERTLIKAIQNNIALYAIHTNLDNVNSGVNLKLGQKLGLKNLRILAPKKSILSKFIVYVPENNSSQVRDAIFESGGGTIGNYSECSFNSRGEGTFKPGLDSNPHVGSKEARHTEKEVKIECVVPNHLVSRVVSNVKKAHPYEEVAYDLISLNNVSDTIGSGMIGELEKEEDLKEFLERVKFSLKVPFLKHTAKVQEKVRSIAICGGSGSFLLSNAIGAQADVFLTADYKYHQFFDADGKIVIVDVGHYESEQYTIELLYAGLKEKFSNFAVHFTQVNTNPVKYF